jgi:hypothetical protein
VDVLGQAQTAAAGEPDDIVERPIAPVDLLGELLEEDLGDLPFNQAA